MRIRSWLVGIALATLLSSGCGLCETVRCWRMNHPILGRLPPRPAAPVIVEPTVPAPPPGQSLYPAIPNGRCCSPTVVSPNGIPPNGTYYAPPANGSYLAPASPNSGMQPTVPRPDSSATPGSSLAPLPSPGWRSASPPATNMLPPQPVQPADHRVPTSSKPDATGGANPAPSLTDLPVDIARWQTPYEGVASGLLPQREGWDWLRQKGYRTVLHLKLPGEDATAIRNEVERRNLRYVALEVSPQTLQRELVQRFSELLADRSLQPIFVTDRDGTIAGAMWYLHYRLAGKLSEEEARRRAVQHGLPETDTRPEVAAWWLAVQNVLKTN